MVTTSSAFSDTYAEARRKFLAVAADRDAAVVSEVHPKARGAQGEELAIDIATFGDREAEKTLFLVSGTHGQEGFLGSALQIEFLRDLQIPAGVNVVALHALNPWGFSHLSRTDDQNIDLNRNFIDFPDTEAEDSLYPVLFRALCPDHWTEDTVDWTAVRDDISERYGMQRLISAVAGGQITEPNGLTYMGRESSWSRRVVERLLPRIFARSKKVAFVEWHTGLGEFGDLSLICSLPAGSDGYQRFYDWLGAAARSPFDASGALSQGKSPEYRGFFSAWVPSTAPQADWAGALIEVGTKDNMAVQDSIRIDWWLKFGRGHTTTPREEMRRIMMETLNPSDPAWRAAAMSNGLETERRMLAGLQQW